MAVLNFVFYALVFIFVIGVLILIHELGHYWAGRLLGFGIEAFSIGFGPKIFEKRGKYNLWQLRLFLIGGYVKFKGEIFEDEEVSNDPTYFYNKKRWERFIVIIMGVFFNILFSYIVFAIIAFYGIEESIVKNKVPEVGYVLKGSPADKAGILKGDTILSIDGKKVSNWEEAKNEISSLMRKEYKIELLRENRRLEVVVNPEIVEYLKQPLGDIGIFPPFKAIVGAVEEGSVADKAGLKPDDIIIEVNGKSVEFWDEVSFLISQSEGKSVSLKIKRKEELMNVEVIPQYREDLKRYLIGIRVKDSELVRYPFPLNFLKAFDIIVDQLIMTKSVLKKLFERKIPLNALSAPPSIAYITSKIARTGLYNLIVFMAIISLQLGFFNLLPIPALDGGQLFILLVEMIIRKDLPQNIKEWILKIGFMLLLLIFVIVFIMDIFKYL